MSAFVLERFTLIAENNSLQPWGPTKRARHLAELQIVRNDSQLRGRILEDVFDLLCSKRREHWNGDRSKQYAREIGDRPFGPRFRYDRHTIAKHDSQIPERRRNAKNPLAELGIAYGFVLRIGSRLVLNIRSAAERTGHVLKKYVG